MPRLQVLAPQVAAKIAAGEVIVRPAAVAKELVENALDAGARTITVDLEAGGVRRLRVVDDGCGMSREEAPLSLLRHATSKIDQEEDLLQITTLGFRGEALPSIAAVSRLEIITRTALDTGGYRLVAVAGDLQETTPWAAASGTQVLVEDLFFNTPVRRKFLKSPEAEQAHLVELLRHLALGYPEVQFLVTSGKKTLLNAPAPQTLAERVASLYGRDLALQLLPVASGGGDWTVQGLMSSPEFSLASSRLQILLVNRRVVADRLLGAVLKTAYQGLLPRGRHPAAFVLLSLPPSQVDVNVHPAKAEVRFADPGRVFPLVLGALRQALGPLTGEKSSYAFTWQPEASPSLEESVRELPFNQPASPSPAPGPAPPPVQPAAPLRPAPGFRFQDLILIGQLHQTYILAQAPQGLVLIDQHAAHERVLYETLARAETPPPRQHLLIPQVVEVKPAQAEWLRQHLEPLREAGLELEPFGGASFLLRAVPACMAQADLEAVVLEMVQHLAPGLNCTDPQRLLEETRTIMACRGAIKAGQTLLREEMQALLAQLDHIAVSSHCPHGRPLWRLIPAAEIRQSFRRPSG